MADAFKCEVCGGLFEGRPANRRPQVVVLNGMQVLVRVSCCTAIGEEAGHFDLCSPCLGKSLAAFMEKAQPKNSRSNDREH